MRSATTKDNGRVHCFLPLVSHDAQFVPDTSGCPTFGTDGSTEDVFISATPHLQHGSGR